jgi:hypothetical protein
MLLKIHICRPNYFLIVGFSFCEGEHWLKSMIFLSPFNLSLYSIVKFNVRTV